MIDRPILIAIDGIDGSGKTTICRYIQNKLDAEYFSSLSTGAIGKEVRKKLLTANKAYNIFTTFFLAMSGNLETIYDYAMPTIQSGKSVVLDRYLSSSYAYQLYRLKESYKESDLFFETLEDCMLDCPVNLYLWCDIDIHTSNKRILERNDSKNHFDLESIHIKENTVKGFEDFYDRLRIKKAIIDCNEPLDRVLLHVDNVLKQYFLNLL